MNKLIWMVCSTISFNAAANDLFANADVKAGKALVEQNCVSCHASSYGGDGSEIYTRAFHKVESSAALVAQVRICNTNLDVKWFEEDELNASAYLNQQYYHFE
jgi:cytochrome c2